MQAPSSVITVCVRQSITQYTGAIDSIHDIMACIMRTSNPGLETFQLLCIIVIVTWYICPV